MLPLQLKGARTHNLSRVSLSLRPGQVVAITGVSGAGKSSLALDTLYAEGQRRFVESFSPYARQFLERLQRPPIDELEPVPAAIAVDRASPVKSSRSTVATMADLEPLLSALFVREAVALCPAHGCEGVQLDASGAALQVIERSGGERVVISYPEAVGGREQYLMLRDRLAQEGYRRLWWPEGTRSIDDVAPSELDGQSRVWVVLDRVRAEPREQGRLAEALTRGFRRGSGLVRVAAEQGEPRLLREGLSCPVCARALDEPVRGLFSYDSPLGACAACRGFGRVIGVDWDKVIPDPYKSLKQRAIRPWAGKSTTWERRQLNLFCASHGIPLDVPWKELSAEARHAVIHGDGSWDDGKFPGVLGWFRWLESRTYKMHVRVLLSRYRSYDACQTCAGRRLNSRALSYRVAGWNLAEWHEHEVHEVLERLRQLTCTTAQGRLIADQLEARLKYLDRVGLGYLSLARQAKTLSGGEAQRVTLTAALGSSLHNAMFVLDEPTVGLHPSDVRALSGAIGELAERNNVVLVVEHDAGLIRAADRVLELGPGSGERGGELVFDGTLRDALRFGGATARACRSSGARRRSPRTPHGWIELQGVRQNNLTGVDVRFPLGVVTAVSGPSGSGKSTLVEEVLYRALARRFGQPDVERPGVFTRLQCDEGVERVVLVDQSPLGRTSRGNTATYTKAWDHVRRLFAREPAAEQRGLSASHFSFNVEGGRCDTCAGEGYETVEMQFLADVRLICPVCQGRRFKPEVLSISCRGQSVADVLDGTVEEALQRFRDCPGIVRALGAVQQLGLGYIRLGQALSTLSGGEAQRLKLARALTEPLRGTLFIVDEPSAGLHADEVERVLQCFDHIVDGGGSVITVEHDLQVIRQADWVIDVGPHAGSRGGQIVFAGTPERLREAETLTAEALRAPSPKPRQRRAKSGSPRAITISGAREHNLKHVSTVIPHHQLTVVTGPSGSGKSSLVFDVVFAEGQRRFLETLSPYARQFLPTLPKADVDEVAGVPPSIALEQRTARAGANSTVATVTELAHYLRLLFAKLGVAHCPRHQEPIGSTGKGVLLERLRRLRGSLSLLSPVVEARKGTYLDVFNAADRDGIRHAWCDGVLVRTDEPPRLARNREHSVSLVMREAASLRGLTAGELDRALAWGGGAVCVRAGDGRIERLSTRSACPSCGFAVPELDPRWFSFNTKQGMCPTCEGQGVIVQTRGRGKTARQVEVPCTECQGARLAAVPRGVRVDGESYAQFNERTVESFAQRLSRLRFAAEQRSIAQPILSELERRAAFLLEVGLGYLTLERPARTLSGGEMQRLRLAAQLGSGLTGALYVLDEPTIGLHARDTQRLIGNLKRLVALGSTVVVVEHDAETIRAADHLVEIGPSGGRGGGRLVFSGSPKQAAKHPDSAMARSMDPLIAPRAPMPLVPEARWLRIEGVGQHNLHDVALALPLGRLTAVVGVSGSGKSTLVRGVLLPAVRQRLGLVTAEPGAFRRLGPLHELKRALSVDQSPIGRTPRSVPATFLGIWDGLRRLFAQSPEAQVAGYSAAHFSFNTANGGRCRTCDGQGVITHEMSFLPNVVTPCPQCGGQRFEPETLRVRYLGLSIGEVLQLSVEEACEVFAHHPKIVAPLKTLVDLGAGYIQLGQGSHTLSGGEAQRLKLAAELTASTRHEPTLYVLDEPTTGLNQADVERLVGVLQRLLDRGDTVVVIEHHPWLIAGADHVVELGPEGGEGGGRVVAQGAPSWVAKQKTATGRVLAQWHAPAEPKRQIRRARQSPRVREPA